MKWLLYLCIPLAAVAAAYSISNQRSWTEWQEFKRHYITAEGRVINSPQQISTSEGQSYALFFALVANDRPAFAKVLDWTESNLAAGDLSAHLPAWLWGQNKQNQWTVLDSNSASDADLWIAYDLLEAGRLWNDTHYQTLGTLLLKRIIQEEVVNIPGLGSMLLPGKQGFVHGDNWVLNPSYSPPQLLERFTAVDSRWDDVKKTSLRMLIETSPLGFSPDWVIWSKQKGWQPNQQQPNRGSYDAIRVYLWVGMLAEDALQKTQLSQHFLPIVTSTEQRGVPPEQINTATGTIEGNGPIGFSAALLPIMSDSPAIELQRQRVQQNPLKPNDYYNSVLILFGQGWDQKYYRFNPQGELLPEWE